MAIIVNVSVKPELIGKENMSYQTGTWQHREMTPDDLIQWAFYGHQGYVHSVFDNDLFINDPGDNKTSRANRFLLFSEMVTVDIDSKDFSDYPEQKDEYLAASQLDALLSNEFVRNHCFAIIPSSGNFLPSKPNYHLCFKLDRRVTRPDEYRKIALAIAAQLPVPTDHQTCKAAQFTAGTLWKNEQRQAAGYHPEDYYVNNEATDVDTASLSLVGYVSDAVGQELAHATERFEDALRYENKDHANKRIKRHLAEELSEREKIVIEALSFVLPTITTKTTYDQWLQIWMSAHFGAPTRAVAEYIVNHEDVYWSDGEAGKIKFLNTFAAHRHQEGGFTVASLFYLAARQGWLGLTGYEIDPDLAREINVPHITDWLDKETAIPRRLILHSQTGSGKTESLISLYHRLNAPKTVVFVPTVKLATELAHKLVAAGLPAILYIDPASGRRLSREELKSAHVLVTTLQTFAIKAFTYGTSMGEYGLVYVEESDQLISQFARGGGSSIYAGSHVSDKQATAGFKVLAAALKESAYVWLVDATMTQVTYQFVTTLSPEPVQYILNTYTREKRPVNFVNTAGDAYRVIGDSLAQGFRVVVACDKRERAHAVVETITGMGLLEGKKALVITKDTEHEPVVRRFMEDVEAGAAEYDLVAYNSVMASGVSIKDTQAEVLVQFCEYLSPRTNLQILNRYRNQGEVFCYYAEIESFYRYSAIEIVERAGHRFDLEGKVISFPSVDRDSLAQLRQTTASISAADEDMQKRSPNDFYRHLLKDDGRQVIMMLDDISDAETDEAMEEARMSRKKISDEAKAAWRDTPRIDEDHPALPGMTPLELEAGKLHGEIMRLLNNALPEPTIPPEDIAEICGHFRGYSFTLAALADQSATARRAEQFLADPSRSTTSLINNNTKLSVLFTVRELYPRLTDVLTQEQVDARRDDFLKELTLRRPQYDTLFERGQYKYENMVEKYGDDKSTLAIMLARVLLSKLGLKLKKVQDPNGRRGQKVYPVEWTAEAERFLNWRLNHDGKTPISLDTIWRGEEFDAHQAENAKRRFDSLTKLEQRVLIEKLNFNTAADIADFVDDGGYA